MPLALEAVPLLLSLLEDDKDPHILNSACLALNRITSAAARCGSRTLTVCWLLQS
jgi:hypothetical protein